MIRNLLGLLAANACFLAAGAGLVRLFGYELRRHVGVAYMAGVASVGVLATLMLIAGLALSAWQALLLCALLAATGFVPRLRTASSPSRGGGGRVGLVAGGLLGIYLAVLFARSVVQPLNAWDAWAHWTMKARAIVLLDGLDPDVFANEAYRPLALDYPMLIPALEAIDFRFMAEPDTLVIHVQFWLLLVGFLVAVYELLRDRVPGSLLWPALLLIGAAPGLAERLTTAYADAPLGFFFALAAIAGWRYVTTGERRAVALFGLLAAAALATKTEGGPFVLGLVVLLLVFVRLRRRPILPVGLAFAASLVAFVPWRIWVAAHDVHSITPVGDGLKPTYLADRADRLGPILRSLTSSLRDGEWLWVLPLALAAVGLSLWLRRGRPTALFAGGVLVAVFGSLVWAYWVGRPGVEWLLGTSADRTVTTLLVFAGTFLPVVAAELAVPRPPPGKRRGGRRERRRQTVGA